MKMENETTVKKKMIIDLDVITVALWDKKGKNAELAKSFLKRIANKEFYIGTPFMIIELVLNWRYEELKNSIKEFYVKNSDKLFTDTEIRMQCDSRNVNFEHVLEKLESAGIKKEDAALIFIASLFSFDYLVTFNRVHLKNKKEESNKILKECGFATIQILGPEEI